MKFQLTNLCVHSSVEIRGGIRITQKSRLLDVCRPKIGTTAQFLFLPFNCIPQKLNPLGLLKVNTEIKQWCRWKTNYVQLGSSVSEPPLLPPNSSNDNICGGKSEN
jgi:hypothetical protein